MNDLSSQALRAAFEAETVREAVRRELVAAEAARASGVAWSGLGAEQPSPASRAVLLRRARRRLMEDAAWRQSRAGRLVAAIAQFQQAALAVHAAAEDARNALARGDSHDGCLAALRRSADHARRLGRLVDEAGPLAT